MGVELVEIESWATSGQQWTQWLTTRAPDQCFACKHLMHLIRALLLCNYIEKMTSTQGTLLSFTMLFFCHRAPLGSSEARSPPGGVDILMSMLDGVPRPLGIGDELYTSYAEVVPFGATSEEQLINYVEMYGTESMAAAQGMLVRLSQQAGKLFPCPNVENIS
jgi:hypothetical protein